MENLWKMIAKARGVELNEEFKWNGSIYKIAEYDGLLALYNSWVKSSNVASFIEGDGKIEKLPFVPKMGECYWTYGNGLGRPYVEKFIWANSCYDKERKLLGIVFRTEQEAKDYLPTWEKRLEGKEC